MYQVEGRNVNHLWARAVPLLQKLGERSTSRAGDVLVMPRPVVSTTLKPRERVLFDPARDANPFFHLFESLWMLAGRNDAAFLDKFVSDFGSRFAEEGHYLYGAYGYRWRGASISRMDQLDVVVRRLAGSPDDRRAVIAMWDADWDLFDPEHRDPQDAEVEPKDLPCNTHVYLRIRNEMPELVPHLDLTVCCRSNDIVWGAYGANAVHFSFLQEYLAGRLGVNVGRLYQLSNNWHAYVPVLERYSAKSDRLAVLADPYSGGTVAPVPIGGENWMRWDDDLEQFMAWVDGKGRSTEYKNRWFGAVAEPMFRAHASWKDGARDRAVVELDDVAASDWAMAAREWMLRRMQKKEAA